MAAPVIDHAVLLTLISNEKLAWQEKWDDGHESRSVM